MTESTAGARNLAHEEKKAARRMSLAGHTWALVAAVVIWLAYLVLPHANGVSGAEVTFFLPSSREAGIKVTEYVYAVLIGLGIGVFTTLVLLTKRTVFGLIAWMLSTVGLFYSVFALWLRQTRPTANDGVDMSVGMYVSIVGVALAVYAYSMVALRRSPEQRQIAEARAASDNLDEVGRAQRDLLDAQRDQVEANPLLVDDRRRKAVERHRRQEG